MPPDVVGRYIQSVEMLLPNGEYELFLDGAKFHARLADSFWEIKPEVPSAANQSRAMFDTEQKYQLVRKILRK